MPPPLDVEAIRLAYLRCWLAPGVADVRPSYFRAAEQAEALSNIALAASWLRLPYGFEPEWVNWLAKSLTSHLAQTATFSHPEPD